MFQCFEYPTGMLQKLKKADIMWRKKNLAEEKKEGKDVIPYSKKAEAITRFLKGMRDTINSASKQKYVVYKIL